MPEKDQLDSCRSKQPGTPNSGSRNFGYKSSARRSISFDSRSTAKLVAESPLVQRLPRPMDSPTWSNRQYNFTALFRSCQPPLPPILRNQYENPLSSNFSGLNPTGKVKVVLCVDQQANSGTALTASAARGTVGGLLSPSHPLSYVSPKLEREPTPGPTSYVSLDPLRNQITLVDPSPLRRRTGLLNPKVFTFDAVLTRDRPTSELCATTLSDTLQAVLRGQDGCILTIGHKRTGKTYSMIGLDDSPLNVGIIPCAISWLFCLLNQQRQNAGVRFSVRVSAVELYGLDEKFRDLLADVAVSHDDGCAGVAPSQYLQDSSPKIESKTASGMSTTRTGKSTEASVALRMGVQLAKQSELRATSAEKAAHFLDVALANRTKSSDAAGQSGLSHMLFTLHVYQCRVERNDSGTNVSGGRTRLHLLDLGCGRYGHQSVGNVDASAEGKPPKRPSKSDRGRVHSAPTNSSKMPWMNLTNATANSSKSLSLSGIANVLLALLTGQRHLPFRDSALTYLLREAMTGNQMQPCVLAHVSAGPQYYTETLQVVQIASKLSRLRRRRVGSTAAGAMAIDAYRGSSNDSNCVEDTASSSVESTSDRSQRRFGRLRYRGPRLGRSSYARSTGSFNSELDYTSSSEHSCDTVIYMGKKSLFSGFGPNASFGNNRSLSKLGPRGTADGSVGDANDYFGQCAGVEYTPNSEGKSGLLEWNKASATGDNRARNSSGGPSNSGTIVTSGVVKRMMPRTNATAWPRSVSMRRAKKLIDSNEETWVDGPRALMQQPSVSDSDARTNQQETKDKQPTPERYNLTAQNVHTVPLGCSIPPPPPPPSYHGHSHMFVAGTLPEASTSQVGSEPQVRVGTCSSNYAQENVMIGRSGIPPADAPLSKEESTVTRPEVNEGHRGRSSGMDGDGHNRGSISEGFENNSVSSGSSSCSTLDRNERCGPRALSDISERTEETEAAPEVRSYKSISTSAFDSLYRKPMLDSLFPGLDMRDPKNGCLTRTGETDASQTPSPQIETGDLILELRKQIRAVSEQTKRENETTRRPSTQTVKDNDLELQKMHKKDMTRGPVAATQSEKLDDRIVGNFSKRDLISECPQDQPKREPTYLMYGRVESGSVLQRRSVSPEVQNTEENRRHPTNPSTPSRYACLHPNSPDTSNTEAYNGTSRNDAILDHKKKSSTMGFESTKVWMTKESLNRSKSAVSEHHVAHTSTSNSLLRVAAWVNSIASTSASDGNLKERFNRPPDSRHRSRLVCPSSRQLSQPHSRPLPVSCSGPKEGEQCNQTANRCFNLPNSRDSRKQSGHYDADAHPGLQTNTMNWSPLTSIQGQTAQLCTPVLRAPPPSVHSGCDPDVYCCKTEDEASQIPQSVSVPNFVSPFPSPAVHLCSTPVFYPSMSPQHCADASYCVYGQKYVPISCCPFGKTQESFNGIPSNFTPGVNKCTPQFSGHPPPMQYVSHPIVLTQPHNPEHPHVSSNVTQTGSAKQTSHPCPWETPSNKPKSKGFSFLTLPLFRGLKLRSREKKSKKDPKQEKNNDVLQEARNQYSMSDASKSLNSTPQRSTDSHLGEQKMWYSPPAARIPLKMTSFGKPVTDDRSPRYDNLAPPGCQSMKGLEVHRGSLPPDSEYGRHFESVESSHCWNFSPEKQEKQHRKRSSKSAKKPQHVSMGHRTGDQMTEYFIHNNEVCAIPSDAYQTQVIGLPNSPSVPLTTLSGHFTPLYRSGRRSVAGGPASSGYESMRIGTSELSLSHHDSASECSALGHSILCKDVAKNKVLQEHYRPRRHSSTAVDPKMCMLILSLFKYSLKHNRTIQAPTTRSSPSSP
ncbi:unnamed protein product [Calicophoron daubneyi]|uniref:Kinesin motor domain-containing protein n=1 Tax=Calicophoron daubneyi TaxID=300641 RepID=A0AAV2T2D4_CALDB